MIVTPDQRLRVFVSSALGELAAERAVVRAAIEGLKLIPVMFEAGARPHPPRTLYQSYLEQSDIFLAIYGERYGWVAPDMDISGLEDEYRLSGAMPRLVYVKTDGEPEPRLEDLLADIQKEGGLSYKPFKSTEELAEVVQNDLVVLLTERFYAADRAANERRPELPAQVSSFVGRDPELEQVSARLLEPEVRILTLTGPGGIGKTRLALETAARLRPHFEDCVYFVPLGDLRDPQLVAETIARALKVHWAGETSFLDTLRDFLRDRSCLLVLDNFEQLLAAAPVVSDLVVSCAGVKVVITSRAPLHLQGEHIYDVPPLATPPVRGDVDRLTNYDAVRLFVDRAVAVNGGFVLDEANAATIAEICARLEGLPLAIELAASRLRVFSPEVLLERLASRFKLLSGGPRDMPDRHRALRDAIAWSYDLLDPESQRLFACLGAFRGGFTLDAVEGICDDDFDVLTTLSTLIDWSLVRHADRGTADPRFLMLETVREYADELLQGSSDHEHVLDRHGRYYVELTLGSRQLIETGQKEAMERLDADLDNLRVAFDVLLERGQADRVAKALLTTWPFWWTRGHLQDGSRWAERTLAREHDLSRLGRGRALAFHSAMAFWRGDYNAALPGFIEAAQIFEEEQDKPGVAITDIALGLVQGFLGDFEGGCERIRRGHHLYEEIGDYFGIIGALNALGWLQATFKRFDESDELLRYTIDVARDVGSQADVGLAQLNLARYLIHNERVDEAVPELRSALDVLASLRHLGATSNVIDIVFEVGALYDRWQDVLVLAGAAQAIRGRLGAENPQPGAERIKELIAEGRATLAPDVADEALAIGCRMNFQESVDAARALLAALDRETQPA